MSVATHTSTPPAALPPAGATRRKADVVNQADLTTFDAVKYDLVDGEVVETKVGRCYPTGAQKVIAESMLNLLNAQIAHDGRWRCVWRDPAKKSSYDPSVGLFRPAMPTVLQCQFLDKDDDCWTVVNIEEDAASILDEGISHWVEQCESAYQWVRNFLFGVMEIREGRDTKAAAKGENLTPTVNMPYPTRL